MPDWVYHTCCYFPKFYGLEDAPFGFCCKCWEKAGRPQPMDADTLLNDDEQAVDGGVEHGR